MPASSGPSWRPSGPLRIGEFRVLPASNELDGPAGPVRLRPLIMDVLLRLAAEPGEVVTRERLIEDVWPRRMVNDEVLSRAIAELRTALGDDPRQARYVETIPKAGYRLVAEVRRCGQGGSRAARRLRRPWWIAGTLSAALLVGGYAALRTVAPPAEALAGATGRRRSRYTADVQLELSPRFSPAGDRVAFVLGEGSETRIVVQAAQGGARRVIGEAGALHHSPVFFPDGRRLAYWRQRGGDCAIVEHDLDSGRERHLLGCALRPRPRFDLSPDGRLLVVTAAQAARRPLRRRRRHRGGLAAHRIPCPAARTTSIPRFSPDGTQVAFFRGTPSHRRLWVLRTGDPASARQLRPWRASPTAPPGSGPTGRCSSPPTGWASAPSPSSTCAREKRASWAREARAFPT